MSVVYKETWKSEIITGRQHPGAHQIKLTFHVSKEGSRALWQVAVSSAQHELPVDTTPLESLEEVQCLDTTFPGDMYIQGELFCHQPRPGELLVEARQLEYGFRNDTQLPQFLMGTLASIPLNGTPKPLPPQPPPPRPPPAPSADEPQPVPVIGPAISQEGELFPYVYMRLWPEPPAEELARQFISYPFPLTMPPSGALLKQLASLRLSGDPDARDQMEQAAITYIEGKEPSDVPFVEKPRTLPAPWSVYPEVYRLACTAGDDGCEKVLSDIWTALGFTCEQVQEQLGTEAYTQTLAAIWQSYFALVIEAGYDARLREELNRLLRVDHLLRGLGARCGEPVTGGLLRALTRASVVLPAALFPLPPEGPRAESPPAKPPARIVPYAIGELQMVQQRFQRYALGELARVENVMAGEWRKSVRRSARSAMQESASRGVDESEHATSARSRTFNSEMANAIADIVTTTTYSADGKGFNITYSPPGASGGATTAFNGGWQLNTGPAVTNGEPSKTEVSRAARQLVQRAADRVAHRVVEERGTRTTSESEETAISVLDNKQGTTGRRGIYRWLNEVYQACIVQYGNRFVLEFLLSTPAANYLRAQEADPGDAVPPVPPTALGIDSFEDITRDNFPALVTHYPGASLALPPGPRTVSGWVRSGEPLTLPLPEGYAASAAQISYVVPPGAAAFQLQGLVGQTPIQIDATATGSSRQELKLEGGPVQVLLHASGPAASPPVELEPVQLTVELEAVPGKTLTDQWQLDTFRSIHLAYTAQLRAYQGASTSEELSNTAPQPRYSSRAVERRELKRGAFDLLAQWLHERVGTEDVPSGWPSQVDVALPRYLQFFERAFEWGEMSYTFIPGMKEDGTYAWGSAGAETGDERFTEFLEAAYAQVLVPVGPDEALAVLYFLASGGLWDSGEEWLPVHESDVALASELKKLCQQQREPRRIGEPWEIVVPTTLTVLQEGPGALQGIDR
jgi:hypothetical protein